MNTLPINTLPELSLKDAARRDQSLSKITLLESTVRMRERADCPVAMGELLAGKYELERVIGIGGMGVVVLAWHAELQQRVALKLLRESFSGHAEARERFRREARAAARISSDHVVRVFDVATLDNGVPYMVMEYLEGENLRELTRAVGPLEEHEVASIVIQVCEALAEAHANQLVHRDLKPENIYLAHRPHRSPLVKVLDFGVSKSLSPNTVPYLKLTPASMLRGSPAYMSPEQLDSKREFDARSDIWSVGVLIYELLTGHLPFEGETLPEVICAVLAGERVPLSQHRPGVSPTMEALLARCLTPDPDDRFRTVQRLAQALRPLVVAHDDWSARLRPHLAPSAAQADVYGKAHIVGESCTSESAFLQATAIDLPAAPAAMACDPTVAAEFGHWPPRDLARPGPGPRRPKLGHAALFAALGGAGLAALVVFMLVWTSSRTQSEARDSGAAHERAAHKPTTADQHALPARLPASLPAPEPPHVDYPDPLVRAPSVSTAPHALPARATAPSSRAADPPSVTGEATVPARPRVIRPLPQQGNLAPPADAVPLTDFGGRR